MKANEIRIIKTTKAFENMYTYLQYTCTLVTYITDISGNLISKRAT
jgi:hypothetical protein